MTPTEILRDLSRNDIFPKEAMAAASARRDAMAPIFVDLLDRVSQQRSGAMADADLMALIPIVYLLAQWRETRAYRPLLRLMRRSPRTLDATLGDAVTESAFRMIAGTFDGDLEPHYHVRCEGCGRLEDVPPSAIGPLELPPETAGGFRLTGMHLELVGQCPACQQAAQQNAE